MLIRPYSLRIIFFIDCRKLIVVVLQLKVNMSKRSGGFFGDAYREAARLAGRAYDVVSGSVSEVVEDAESHLAYRRQKDQILRILNQRITQYEAHVQDRTYFFGLFKRSMSAVRRTRIDGLRTDIEEAENDDQALAAFEQAARVVKVSHESGFLGYLGVTQSYLYCAILDARDECLAQGYLPSETGRAGYQAR